MVELDNFPKKLKVKCPNCNEVQELERREFLSGMLPQPVSYGTGLKKEGMIGESFCRKCENKLEAELKLYS